MQMRLL